MSRSLAKRVVFSLATASLSPGRTRPCSRAIATCSCSWPTRTGASRSRTVATARARWPAGSLSGTPRPATRRSASGSSCSTMSARTASCGGRTNIPRSASATQKAPPIAGWKKVAPVLKEYDEGSAQPVMQAIEAAREKRVQDDLDAFLAKRFGQRMVEPIKAIHLVEEERPIETLWDVTVAATAHARSIPNNDKRLEIERAAGELLKLAA